MGVGFLESILECWRNLGVCFWFFLSVETMIPGKLILYGTMQTWKRKRGTQSEWDCLSYQFHVIFIPFCGPQNRFKFICNFGGFYQGVLICGWLLVKLCGMIVKPGISYFAVFISLPSSFNYIFLQRLFGIIHVYWRGEI